MRAGPGVRSGPDDGSEPAPCCSIAWICSAQGDDPRTSGRPAGSGARAPSRRGASAPASCTGRAGPRGQLGSDQEAEGEEGEAEGHLPGRDRPDPGAEGGREPPRRAPGLGWWPASAASSARSGSSAPAQLVTAACRRLVRLRLVERVARQRHRGPTRRDGLGAPTGRGAKIVARSRRREAGRTTGCRPSPATSRDPSGRPARRTPRAATTRMTTSPIDASGPDDEPRKRSSSPFGPGNGAPGRTGGGVRAPRTMGSVAARSSPTEADRPAPARATGRAGARRAARRASRLEPGDVPSEGGLERVVVGHARVVRADQLHEGVLAVDPRTIRSTAETDSA